MFGVSLAALSDPAAKENCMMHLLRSLPEPNLMTFLTLLEHLKRYLICFIIRPCIVFFCISWPLYYLCVYSPAEWLRRSPSTRCPSITWPLCSAPLSSGLLSQRAPRDSTLPLRLTSGLMTSWHRYTSSSQRVYPWPDRRHLKSISRLIPIHMSVPHHCSPLREYFPTCGCLFIGR